MKIEKLRVEMLASRLGTNFLVWSGGANFPTQFCVWDSISTTKQAYKQWFSQYCLEREWLMAPCRKQRKLTVARRCNVETCFSCAHVCTCRSNFQKLFGRATSGSIHFIERHLPFRDLTNTPAIKQKRTSQNEIEHVHSSTFDGSLRTKQPTIRRPTKRSVYQRKAWIDCGSQQNSHEQGMTAEQTMWNG